MFLDPFGLGDFDRPMAGSAEAARSIVARNPQLAPQRFLVPWRGAPRVRDFADTTRERALRAQ